MLTAEDSRLFLAHLTDALEMAASEGDALRARKWLQCEVDRGPGRSHGWGGEPVHFLGDKTEYDELRARVVTLRRQGLKIEDIAFQVNRSPDRVAHILSEEGVKKDDRL